MVGSKDLQPSDTPFFPHTFFYNQFWAARQWPDPSTTLSGQIAIITGSNTGLGYEAAVQLLELNLSHLILAVRSVERGERAAAKLRQLHPEANIDVWHLDMSFYDSIQRFVQRVESDLSHVDLVLLNAGVVMLNYTTNEETGHENCMQTNFLSTVLLMILLLPTLRSKGSSVKGQPVRLTIASAGMTLASQFPHREADPLLSSFDDPDTFDPYGHYGASKLLMQMILWNLVDYVSADDVVVNLADPSWCRGTEISRDISGWRRVRLAIMVLLGRTPQVGASCYVDALVSKGKESHGCFLMSWQIHSFPAFLYTDTGKVVRQRIWDETMAELQKFDVNAKLDLMKAPCHS